MSTDPIYDPALRGDFAGEVTALWKEILGAAADISSGFLENGGDSFSAVLLADRLYRLTGREIDYLDVLEADGSDAISRLLATDGSRR